MMVLGLESSCDETAAAVVEMGEETRTIRSNVVASQIDVHRLYGGVVPEIASRAHIEAIGGVTRQALREAGVTVGQLDAVAVTACPGLIGALLVGVNFAKSLAWANRLPLVAVNHIHAHVAAACLCEPGLRPPFAALVVSGGHTCFYRVTSWTDFAELGGTRDDAAGEAFDKVGRVIGLPYPSGAAMDRLAAQGNPGAVALPSPALAGDTPDLSFSGLKTAALNYLNGMAQRGETVNRADLAASYTRQITDALTRKAALVLEQTGLRTLVLAGGVAANSHLRAALGEMCRAQGCRLCLPTPALCGDNGAMVAAAGYFRAERGLFAGPALNASAGETLPDAPAQAGGRPTGIA